jgi:hypothetical protein
VPAALSRPGVGANSSADLYSVTVPFLKLQSG